MGYAPQTNLGWDPCVLLQGTLGLAPDKLLEQGQALAGALTTPLHCGVDTRSPTCTSVELGTPRHTHRVTNFDSW